VFWVFGLFFKVPLVVVVGYFPLLFSLFEKTLVESQKQFRKRR